MYKEVLQGINHIAIWPVISFVIFFSFFIGLVWWASTADRKYISEMQHMPLDEKANQEQ